MIDEKCYDQKKLTGEGAKEKLICLKHAFYLFVETSSKHNVDTRFATRSTLYFVSNKLW